ncbi:hypothetical protein CDAR_556351 [Caerostris darwini]|uniref:Uncharacterized protein n=1 Tax=Caerostris darwini TaxID=1538125 RepID=A0AAV4TZU7_9ARAC|nr:hypothetical protein CDAR_556351 [Caerostris darwini]
MHSTVHFSIRPNTFSYVSFVNRKPSALHKTVYFAEQCKVRRRKKAENLQRSAGATNLHHTEKGSKIWAETGCRTRQHFYVFLEFIPRPDFSAQIGRDK